MNKEEYHAIYCSKPWLKVCWRNIIYLNATMHEVCIDLDWKINRIEHDGKDPSTKEKLVREYQSIVGSINWLTINTQPNINTVYSLLSQFNLNPSQGHLEVAKYVLWYLKHTSSHGIWFRQGENRLHGSVAIRDSFKRWRIDDFYQQQLWSTGRIKTTTKQD